VISRGQGREAHGGRLGLLVLFLFLSVTFLGCTPTILGEKHLIPDPLWAQSGKEIRKEFLVSSLGKSTVEVKYMEKDELLELLSFSSHDPALFEPVPPLFGGMTPFLMEVTNSSGALMVLEGQHAIFQDDEGSKLYSVGFPELYLNLSDDPRRDEKMKILQGLLFSSTPIPPGNSKKGLLLFAGLPDPAAKRATLTISFLYADKALKSEPVSFPFTIEAVPGDKGEAASEEEAIEK
jgi:hypothetical protein